MSKGEMLFYFGIIGCILFIVIFVILRIYFRFRRKKIIENVMKSI